MIDHSQSLQETVFIVDDDPAICEALGNLLEAVGIPTSSYSSAEAFEAAWQADSAGCLLLDARLPGMSGVEFQQRMTEQGITLPVVFMTAHGDIAMVRKVLKGGAMEFLVKPFLQEELLEAIQQAFARDRLCRKEREELASIERRISRLSERERQVMARVTQGFLNKQVAAELGVSEITVKLHRRKVMERMEVESLAELVKLCERVRFVHPAE